MHLVVHVHDTFVVGRKNRCDEFGKDLGRLVPVTSLCERTRGALTRQGVREGDYFAPDVHGRIGRDV